MPYPPPLPAQSSRAPVVWVVVGVVLFAVVIGGGIFSAILIPTVAKVRETARRTADARNVRQIAQAALIYAAEHDGALSPTPVEGDALGGRMTMHALATAFANEGGLNDASCWFSVSDRQHKGAPLAIGVPVLDAQGALDPRFAAERVFAWDFAIGLTTAESPFTPIAWTRGLRPDGTWNPEAGVYGSDGGHIAFLGGNVNFFRDLRSSPLPRPGGKPTSNILETLPESVRIVGAGPGSLNGKHGLAPVESGPVK